MYSWEGDELTDRAEFTNTLAYSNHHSWVHSFMDAKFTNTVVKIVFADGTVMPWPSPCGKIYQKSSFESQPQFLNIFGSILDLELLENNSFYPARKANDQWLELGQYLIWGGIEKRYLNFAKERSRNREYVGLVLNYRSYDTSLLVLAKNDNALTYERVCLTNVSWQQPEKERHVSQPLYVQDIISSLFREDWVKIG